jgi:hypothetical protein
VHTCILPLLTWTRGCSTVLKLSAIFEISFQMMTKYSVSKSDKLLQIITCRCTSYVSHNVLSTGHQVGLIQFCIQNWILCGQKWVLFNKKWFLIIISTQKSLLSWQKRNLYRQISLLYTKITFVTTKVISI